MGILDLFRSGSGPRERVEPTFRAASLENPSTSLSDPASWLADALSGYGGGHAFGPPVNEHIAMACSTIFRCVVIISGMVAETPLKIYKRAATGREEQPAHRLAEYFQVAPYPGRAMSAYTWRENWSVTEQLWGNHYSIIRRDGAAREIGFEPVLPGRTQIYRKPNGRLIYRCEVLADSAGHVEDSMPFKVEWHDQDDMIHIPGIGFNSVLGASRIRAFGRNAVSLHRMLEEQVGIAHENAAAPSAFVTYGQLGQKLNPDAFARFKAQFHADNTGRSNYRRVIYGDVGATFTPMSIPLEDLETISSRRYQVAELSRIFGVPLHLLNETEGSTSWGSGLAEQTLAFLIYTLNPIFGRIEAELNLKLFHGTGCYIEFDRDALMAMDPLKSAQVAQSEIFTGSLLIDERRRHKNRPPLPGGMGMQPLVNAAVVSLASVLNPAYRPPPLPPTPAPNAPGAPNADDPGAQPPS